MPIEVTTGRMPLSTIPIRLHKYTSQRRSLRVMLSVKILVGGNRLDRQRFSEEALTSVVSAHGALIFLVEKVTLGQLLTIRNVKSDEETRGEVVDVGLESAGKFEVGVEFHLGTAEEIQLLWNRKVAYSVGREPKYTWSQPTP